MTHPPWQIGKTVDSGTDRTWIVGAIGQRIRLITGRRKVRVLDEPHDRAFVWNILCCAWTVIHKPEMIDV